MRRQRIRHSLLIISLLLFPITQFYFSPYISIDGAAQGIVSGSLLVFVVLFLAGIFVGRAPCGWIMPCGGLQEVCFYANDKAVPVGGKDYIKRIIWVVWFGLLLTLLLFNFGHWSVDPLYHIAGGISISAPVFFIIYYAVLIVFVANSLLIGKRASCHYICWMAPFMILGRALGNAINAPRLQLSVDADACVSCRHCSASCPMGIDVHQLIQTNRMEHPECIFCHECVSQCPEHALAIQFQRSK